MMLKDCQYYSGSGFRKWAKESKNFLEVSLAPDSASNWSWGCQDQMDAAFGALGPKDQIFYLICQHFTPWPIFFYPPNPYFLSFFLITNLFNFIMKIELTSVFPYLVSSGTCLTIHTRGWAQQPTTSHSGSHLNWAGFSNWCVWPCLFPAASTLPSFATEGPTSSP